MPITDFALESPRSCCVPPHPSPHRRPTGARPRSVVPVRRRAWREGLGDAYRGVFRLPIRPRRHRVARRPARRIPRRYPGAARAVGRCVHGPGGVRDARTSGSTSTRARSRRASRARAPRRLRRCSRAERRPTRGPAGHSRDMRARVHPFANVPSNAPSPSPPPIQKFGCRRHAPMHDHFVPDT
jgi:hypothetical protein